MRATSAAFVLVREAMWKKRGLIVMYKDTIRTVWPHILGWTSNEEVCLVWQTVPEAGWRTLKVTDLTVLHQLPETDKWSTSHNRTGNQNTVTEVCLRVEID